MAEAQTDHVLLVDVSTSMRDLFPEVRERLYQEVDRAEVGDRVVILTFGERAHLVARRRIRGAADRAYLRAIIQGLEPRERATYLTQGLDRGFGELLALFETAPDRDRRLLWLSDDKNNPPPDLGPDVFTLKDLRAEHQEFQPEGEWFAFDAPLGEGVSNELAEFLQWARRTLFTVSVRETGVALGARQGPEFTTTTTVHFSPQHSGLAGLEFLVLARVSDPSQPAAPHMDVKVAPSVVTVQAQDWEQEFTLTYAGPPGGYAGFLVFESYARRNFRVEPERIPLTFSVEPPIVEAQVPPEEPQTLTEIAEEILATAERAPGATRADRPLEFGPVTPGSTFTKVIPLSTNGPVSARQIALRQDIPLPSGFTLTAEIRGEGTLFEARLRLEVADTAEITEPLLQGGAVQGRITFAADDPNIAVSPLYRNVLVVLDQRRERWGRRLLPEQAPIGRTRAEELGFEAIGELQDAAGAPRAGETPGTLERALGIARTVGTSPYAWGAVALAVVAALVVWRMRRRQTAFFGDLVVIKDPNPRKMRNVSLARLAGGTGRDALTIGSDARSDVRLQHESVRDLHARLLAVPVGDSTVIMLQAARGTEVKVNDQIRTERVRLNDKDLIAIGDYIFLFSSPEPQKHVVVRFLDGSVLRGTPLALDLAEPSFQLLLDDPAGGEEVAHVDFADLKAVFFVQEAVEDERQRERIPEDRLMKEFEFEVEFQDGEKLEGYALTDYTDYAPRFYLVPKQDPTIISVLIERGNTREVAQRPRTDGTPRGGALPRFFSRS